MDKNTEIALKMGFIDQAHITWAEQTRVSTENVFDTLVRSGYFSNEQLEVIHSASHAESKLSDPPTSEFQVDVSGFPSAFDEDSSRQIFDEIRELSKEHISELFKAKNIEETSIAQKSPQSEGHFSEFEGIGNAEEDASQIIWPDTGKPLYESDLKFVLAILKQSFSTKMAIQKALMEIAPEDRGKPIGQILLKQRLIDGNQYYMIHSLVNPEATNPISQSAIFKATRPENTRTIGRFIVEREIAQGGMGIIYDVIDPNNNQHYALKLLKGHSKALVERFKREAAVASLLDHPNIIGVHEFGETDDSFFFTMKLVSGEDLDELIPRWVGNHRYWAELMILILDAIGFAHSQNIIHRDLKPANILVDKEGNPHITDFGLAKLINDDLSLTQSGVMVGTPYYMSPEQVRGHTNEVGIQSDIFSLGVVFYEMLCGRKPFLGNTAMEIYEQILHKDPIPLRQLDRTVPKELQYICLKCLSKPKNARYNNVKEIIQDIKTFLEGGKLGGLASSMNFYDKESTLFATNYYDPNADSPSKSTSRLPALPSLNTPQNPPSAHLNQGSSHSNTGPSSKMFPPLKKETGRLDPLTQKISPLPTNHPPSPTPRINSPYVSKSSPVLAPVLPPSKPPQGSNRGYFFGIIFALLFLGILGLFGGKLIKLLSENKTPILSQEELQKIQETEEKLEDILKLQQSGAFELALKQIQQLKGFAPPEQFSVKIRILEQELLKTSQQFNSENEKIEQIALLEKKQPELAIEKYLALIEEGNLLQINNSRIHSRLELLQNIQLQIQNKLQQAEGFEKEKKYAEAYTIYEELRLEHPFSTKIPRFYVAENLFFPISLQYQDTPLGTTPLILKIFPDRPLDIKSLKPTSPLFNSTLLAPDSFPHPALEKQIKSHPFYQKPWSLIFYTHKIPAWEFKAKDKFEAKPVWHQGKFVVGDGAGILHILNEKGQEIEQFSIPSKDISDTILSECIYEPKRRLWIFGSYTGRLFALNESFKQVWEIQTRSKFELPPLLYDEDIYTVSVSSRSYRLQSFSLEAPEDSKRIWSTKTTTTVPVNPLITPRMLYWPSEEKFVGFEVDNRKNRSVPILQSPIVGTISGPIRYAEDSFYTATANGQILIFNENDLKIKRKVTLPSPFLGDLQLTDQDILVTCTNNTLYSYSRQTANSNWNWKQELLGTPLKSIVVHSTHSRIYTATKNGWVYALDFQGNIQWVHYEPSPLNNIALVQDFLLLSGDSLVALPLKE